MDRFDLRGEIIRALKLRADSKLTDRGGTAHFVVFVMTTGNRVPGCASMPGVLFVHAKAGVASLARQAPWDQRSSVAWVHT